MRLFLIAALAAICTCAHADEITLIAPGGIRAPIQKMIPDFERRTGHTVKATFGLGNGTKKQVMSGEAFDVPIVQPPPEVAKVLLNYLSGREAVEVYKAMGMMTAK